MKENKYDPDAGDLKFFSRNQQEYFNDSSFRIPYHLNVEGTWLDPERSEIRSPQEVRERMEELRISQVSNGWIVKAGCMTFVFDDATKLAVELTRYLQDPMKVREEYIKKFNAINGPALAGEGEMLRSMEYQTASRVEDRFNRGEGKIGSK